MRTIKINGGQFLKGDIVIPPSKSLSHRGIIAAGLAEGVSQVSNVIDSKDIQVTLACMKNLGAEIEAVDNGYRIAGIGKCMKLSGSVFDCHESGSTLRFMIPIAMQSEQEVTFVGTGKLVTRPLQPYFDIFNRLGTAYTYDQGLPLRVKGPLKAGRYELPGNVSSQFITGLLYALPLLEGDSEIVVTSPLESKGYVDLTLDVLSKYGISVKNQENQSYIISGSQSYKARDYRVEGDFSQVAFWLVAGLINGDIHCMDMSLDSLQGDREVLEIIRRMKGAITASDHGIHAVKSQTQATVIDGSQCPDIIPVLAVLAAVTPGETHIVHAERLRIKECDRLKAITTELNKLGAQVTELADGLVIQGVDQLRGGTVQGWNDHRIVMSMAVASLACNAPVIIEGCEAINKSYPHFFEDFKQLGGKIDEWHLES